MIHSIILFCALSIPPLHAMWNPHQYSESNDGQFKNGIKEIHKLALTGSESILDIGCGDGRLSQHIATTCIPRGHLVGIDNSQAMIDYAQASHAAPNVSFAYGDIAHYDAPDQYDVVVSFWSLHWVPKYEKALCTIARALKPHGKALLCHLIEAYPLNTWIEKTINKPKWHGLQSEYVTTLRPPSLEQVLNAIKKSGLSLEHMEVKKNNELSSVETVRKNLLSTPILASIPDSVREEFCDDLFKELITAYLNKDGLQTKQAPLMVVLVLKKI